MVAKLNLDIANICKSNSFHFIDNNNTSINFLYKDGLYLFYSGTELQAKTFYCNTMFYENTYHPSISLNWKEVL